MRAASEGVGGSGATPTAPAVVVRQTGAENWAPEGWVFIGGELVKEGHGSLQVSTL